MGRWIGEHIDKRADELILIYQFGGGTHRKAMDRETNGLTNKQTE